LPIGIPYFYISDGTPIIKSIFAAETSHVKTLINIARNWRLVYPNKPFFIFIGLNVWGVDSLKELKEVAGSLGDEFVVVRPDEMFRLMRSFKSV